jgi:hypothetical protein
MDDTDRGVEQKLPDRYAFISFDVTRTYPPPPKQRVRAGMETLGKQNGTARKTENERISV